MQWFAIEPLSSERLTLEPVSDGHASSIVEVLSDTALYEFTGGEPPSLAVLTARYRSQMQGPADGSRAWFNRMVRQQNSGALVGFVQATVQANDGDALADIAWVINPAHQNQGLATEATAAMVGWLNRMGWNGLLHRSTRNTLRLSAWHSDRVYGRR
jgi:RimJ/RimL family protein N-acetyltransferase